jgi:hypothetical protein
VQYASWLSEQGSSLQLGDRIRDLEAVCSRLVDL